MLVLVVMTAAYMFAIVQSSTIAFIMLMAYGFVSQFFPLVIGSLFFPGRVNAKAALWALGTGVVITAFFTVGPIQRPGGFHPGFLGLVGNSLVLLALTGRPQENS